MSQEVRRGRRAARVVLQLYREHEPHIEAEARRVGVTCREGCSQCCRLPATTTVPEMIPVVEYLAGRSDWEARRPALERELTHQLEEFAGVNVLDAAERAAFFKRQLPCAFLKEDRCEIYKVRPAVCRYHMVVSPPEACTNGDGQVTLVDFDKIEVSVALAAAEAYGSLTGGPIAVAFVLAADLLGVRLRIDRALLDRVMICRVPVPARR